MRFAWTLDGPLDTLANDATAAERAGFDAVWIDRTDVEGTAAAAHLASATGAVRVGITVLLGVEHPVEIAEQVAVADLALGGRLVVAVRPAPDVTIERVSEALDLLLDCLASHPFRHAGPMWPTPANLPANRHSVEDRVRVAPAPAQFELPVWVLGPAARPAAMARGLGIVVDADEAVDALAAWSSGLTPAERLLTRRARRVLRWVPPLVAGSLDAERAVADLRAWQRAADVDLAVVAGPVPGPRDVAMHRLMRRVRPHVQLDRLPPGLAEHWATEPSRPTDPIAPDRSHHPDQEGPAHG